LARKQMAAKSRKAGGERSGRKDAGEAEAAYITTAVHIPRATHDLLRRAAFKRALDDGGRASVSALVVEIVERHRKELEAEAKA
jgi:hypothetical protein